MGQERNRPGWLLSFTFLRVKGMNMAVPSVRLDTRPEGMAKRGGRPGYSPRELHLSLTRAERRPETSQHVMPMPFAITS